MKHTSIRAIVNRENANDELRLWQRDKENSQWSARAFSSWLCDPLSCSISYSYKAPPILCISHNLCQRQLLDLSCFSLANQCLSMHQLHDLNCFSLANQCLHALPSVASQDWHFHYIGLHMSVCLCQSKLTMLSWIASSVALDCCPLASIANDEIRSHYSDLYQQLRTVANEEDCILQHPIPRWQLHIFYTMQLKTSLISVPIANW